MSLEGRLQTRLKLVTVLFRENQPERRCCVGEELVNEWIVKAEEDAKTCVNIIHKFRDNMRLLLNGTCFELR